MGGSRGGTGSRPPPPLPGKSQVAIGLLTDSGRDRSREAIGPGYILVLTALEKQLDLAIFWY